MLAVDTNILVYAHREDSNWFRQADRVLADLAEGTSLWAIPWPCLYEFFAIVTHPRIYNPPSPVPDALLQMRRWLESPSLVVLSEGTGFFQVFERVIKQSAVVGPAVHDARIAALCFHHGVQKLLSADRDFSRFPDLRTQNPLQRE